jgi:uncharacterized protein YceK
MKRIFALFLSVLLLSGCGCVLSQIPPQYIYSAAGCSAPLPDYRLKITATDNCSIASFTQTPAPGFQLNSTTMITDVTVKATDTRGNFSQVVFSVTLLDTVKPSMVFDASLTSRNLEQIKEIYNAGDKLIAWEMLYWANNFDESQFPGLHEWNEANNADSTYFNQTMLTWTSPGFAFNGKGSRIHTWINMSDTVVFRIPPSYTSGDKTPSISNYLDYDLRLPRGY